MKITGVSGELCTLCGACAEECCADLFSRKTDPADGNARMVHVDPHSGCTGGGHGLRDHCRGDDADMPIEAAIRIREFGFHSHRHCRPIPYS